MKPGLMLAILIAWTLAAFTVGYKVRSFSAEAAAQTVQAATQEARIDAVTDARATDHGNAQAAVQSEQSHIDRATAQAGYFAHLKQDIDTYARTRSPNLAEAHACVRGDAGPDFLRIWRAANAGAFSDQARHHDPAVAASAAGGPAAASERQ